MSKITFRADDDLVRRLEECDASKSEVMRDALRAHLGSTAPNGTSRSAQTAAAESLDGKLAERVDRLVAERLDAAFTRREPRNVEVNVTVERPEEIAADRTDDRTAATADSDADRGSAPDDRRAPCKRCGETLSPAAVYCANCGEKATHRVFCDCGEELDPEWGFCPGCGRRTPAASMIGET